LLLARVRLAGDRLLARVRLTGDRLTRIRLTRVGRRVLLGRVLLRRDLLGWVGLLPRIRHARSGIAGGPGLLVVGHVDSRIDLDSPSPGSSGVLSP
jgi:hypothetical protein